MTPQEKIAKLTEAARLLDEVRVQMDTRERTCAHCGRVTYLNWTEQQAATTLQSLGTKIDGIIRRTREGL